MIQSRPHVEVRELVGLEIVVSRCKPSSWSEMND